jgi:hypothetical protein
MNSIKSQASKAHYKTATDTASVFERARTPGAVANEPLDNWKLQ